MDLFALEIGGINLYKGWILNFNFIIKYIELIELQINGDKTVSWQEVRTCVVSKEFCLSSYTQSISFVPSEPSQALNYQLFFTSADYLIRHSEQPRTFRSSWRLFWRQMNLLYSERKCHRRTEELGGGLSAQS